MLRPRTMSSREPVRSVRQTLSARHSLRDAPFLADLPLLLDDSRPNGLLIGPRDTTSALLRALDGFVAAPIFHSPLQGYPWTTRERIATLIIHDLHALDHDAQRKLLAWMDAAGRDSQVIAVAPAPVYPLVQGRHFSARLYYRVNHVYIEAHAKPDGLPDIN